MTKKKKQTFEEAYKELVDKNMKEAAETAEKYAKWNIQHDVDLADKLDDMFQKTFDSIQKEIDSVWTENFNPKGKVSIKEAKATVARIDELIKNNQSLSDIPDMELKRYRALAQLNKLQMLEAQVGSKLIEKYGDIEGFFKNELSLEAARAVEQASGIFSEFVTMNAVTNLNAVVNAKFYGASWFDRLYSHNTEVANNINDILTRAMINGENPSKYAAQFARTNNIATQAAKDLLVTEASRVNASAQKKQMEDMGFDEYEFISTEDHKRCIVCGGLHGKRFKVKDMQPGKNCHPMHTKCRCTSVGVFEDPADVMKRLEKKMAGKAENSSQAETETKAKTAKDVFTDTSKSERTRDFMNSFTGKLKAKLVDYDGEEYLEADGPSTKLHKGLGEALTKERPLSKSEEAALFDYSKTGYSYINNFLRGKTNGMATVHQEYLKDIMNVFKDSKAPANITTYRGVKNLDIFNDLKVGDVYADKGISSVTTDLKKAHKFTNGYSPTIFRIHIQEGTPMIDVRQVSKFKSENEVILQPNQPMQVIGTDTQDGVKYVDVVVKPIED